MGIAQQLGCQRKSSIQPLSKRNFHTAASNAGLVFRNGSQKRQRHVCILVQREDAFTLEENAHWIAELRKIPHHSNTVNGISGKARNRFSDDQVDFSGSAVSEHLV